MKPEDEKITPEAMEQIRNMPAPSTDMRARSIDTGALVKPDDKKIVPNALEQMRMPAPSIEMPARFIDTRAGREFANRTVRFQFIYSVIGLVLGLSSMVIGGFLCWSGVTGHSSLSAKLFGAATELFDAATGDCPFRRRTLGRGCDAI